MRRLHALDGRRGDVPKELAVILELLDFANIEQCSGSNPQRLFLWRPRSILLAHALDSTKDSVDIEVGHDCTRGLKGEGRQNQCTRAARGHHERGAGDDDDGTNGYLGFIT